MKKDTLRVRFAPAPTGMMHLGNIRTALMNYLMAQQKQGQFVLRIEDTDAERNYDPEAVKIQEDLHWLSLTPDEGPQNDGGYGPYFQSQRNAIYQEKLQELINMGLAYRCFCSVEELEAKRQRQIALKQPPRYDRTCLKLSAEQSDEKATTTPFVWRVKLDHTDVAKIKDLAHGVVTFEFKNFSDFPITRQDGSVTFIFANFVDDMLMHISCVIRGEDHLSNTASQAALYKAFKVELPLFWHMPILCNIDGKKLSKRDFGFSLRDLKDSGFLPEAIVNYLAIIGGSFKQEIMSMEELTQNLNFDHISTTGQIKYDVEKLRWVNHKWINKLEPQHLLELCKPYLAPIFPEIVKIPDATLSSVLQKIASEMITLQDCVELMAFYFAQPVCSAAHAHALTTPENSDALTNAIKVASLEPDKAAFLATLKSAIAQAKIPNKEAFTYIRYLLTGSEKGLGIADLIEILDYEKIKHRLSNLIE